MQKHNDKSALIRELFTLSLEKGETALAYFGYAGVIVRIGARAIAIDLGKFLKEREIGAIDSLHLQFFTHNHWDHFTPETTVRILEKTGAQIIAEQQVIEDLKGKVPPNNLIVSRIGETMNVDGFKVFTVQGIHPRPINLFRIEKDGFSFFHGGDSGYVKVEKGAVDLAFLPTGSPSPTCSPENALKFTTDLQPRVVVAMHGTKSQMNKFKRLVKKARPQIHVVVPEPYKPRKMAI